MSLTPFKISSCTGCPMAGGCTSNDGPYQDDLEEAILLLEVLWCGESDEAAGDVDDLTGLFPANEQIAHDEEMELAWKDYAQSKDKQLAQLTWLRTTQPGRRPGSKRFTRRGRRYRVIQDHGTAAGKHGIELAHQYRADINDSTLYWSHVRQDNVRRRARLADLATWYADPDNTSRADKNLEVSWEEEYDWYLDGPDLYSNWHSDDIDGQPDETELEPATPEYNPYGGCLDGESYGVSFYDDSQYPNGYDAPEHYDRELYGDPDW